MATLNKMREKIYKITIKLIFVFQLILDMEVAL